MARRMSQQERLAEIGRGQAYLMHEMRRPLVTIGLLARLLRKRSDLREKDGEALDTIIELANSGEALLRDCLHFVGPTKKGEEKVRVEDMLKGIRRSLSRRAKSAGVTVDVQHCVRYRPLISCARRRLRQALLNIAENSLEAMANGGGRLVLTCHETPDRVVIGIRDTGPGIEPEARAHMFKPFFSTKKSGSGLGLALAKKIIEDHDGKIAVRSKPGEGTSVTVKLPRHTG
ncbi:hypothetical protein JW848_08835 [Candidatus Bipolaricaulota bacterium]|nr:hypothetical protein [Candidatus Bipolaricaulota bacterium]